MGNKAARDYIAMIKVVAPSMALRVIDRAVQAHGAAGMLACSFIACPEHNFLSLHRRRGQASARTSFWRGPGPIFVPFA